MTLKNFLGFIDIGYDKVPGGYDIYDKQGTYELTDYDEILDEETSVYPDIPSVVDRVSGIWYDWIYEDLYYEFGCREDFLGDFNEMLAWMQDNKKRICVGDYEWYTEVIECILNPDLITE